MPPTLKGGLLRGGGEQNQIHVNPSRRTHLGKRGSQANSERASVNKRTRELRILKCCLRICKCLVYDFEKFFNDFEMFLMIVESCLMILKCVFNDLSTSLNNL